MNEAKSIISKQTSWNEEGFKYNMFKWLKNLSDAYHDTRIHYLMEEDSLLLQYQTSVMDIVVGDTWNALKKRGAPQGHAQVVGLSVLHV